MFFIINIGQCTCTSCTVCSRIKGSALIWVPSMSLLSHSRSPPKALHVSSCIALVTYYVNCLFCVPFLKWNVIRAVSETNGWGSPNFFRTPSTILFFFNLRPSTLSFFPFIGVLVYPLKTQYLIIFHFPRTQYPVLLLFLGLIPPFVSGTALIVNNGFNHKSMMYCCYLTMVCRKYSFKYMGCSIYYVMGVG